MTVGATAPARSPPGETPSLKYFFKMETPAGFGALAVTLKVCATGCTVSVVESLSPNGEGPLQVAETVSVTMTFGSVVFAGAVYVGLCTVAEGLKLPPAPPSTSKPC